MIIGGNYFLMLNAYCNQKKVKLLFIFQIKKLIQGFQLNLIHLQFNLVHLRFNLVRLRFILIRLQLNLIQLKFKLAYLEFYLIF